MNKNLIEKAKKDKQFRIKLFIADAERRATLYLKNKK